MLLIFEFSTVVILIFCRLAPWLAHVMVSRQETARALLTPGEVMQLPPTDELVLVSGLAPIRATKLRYYQDANFTSRVAPAPVLTDGRYADRPKARSDDWGRLARLPDVRLKHSDDALTESEDGGMQQARHPGLASEAPVKPVEPDAEQLAIADEADDVAADQRAMDQARGPNPVTRGYALNESSGRDLLPGL